MSVVYDPIQPGEDVNAENVQQIIDGITAQTAVAHSMKNDSATVAALTLQSTHVTGPALSIKDSSGVEQIKIHRQQSSNIYPDPGGDYQYYETLNLGDNGKIVSRTGGSAPIHSHLWDVYRTDAESGTIALEIVQDNNYLGTPSTGDAATVAFLGRRFSGDGYWRTMELDAINTTDAGSMTQPYLGIELTIQSVENTTATGINDITGISIQNLGQIWEPGSPWKAIDNGLLVGGISSHRITYPIRVGGNDADVTLGLYSAGTELFRVNYLGKVEAGDVYPRTDSAFDLGGVSTNWRFAWVDNYFSTKGISASEVHYSLGATSTGFGLPATNAIGIFNAATETIRITSAGIIDFRNGQSAAPGGGATATLATVGGSGPTTAAQNTWVKIKINGTDFWFGGWA